MSDGLIECLSCKGRYAPGENHWESCPARKNQAAPDPADLYLTEPTGEWGGPNTTVVATPDGFRITTSHPDPKIVATATEDNVIHLEQQPKGPEDWCECGTCDKSILAEAAELVAGDRAAEYGDATDNMARWTGAINAVYGFELEAHDGAIFMELLKIVRVRQSPTKRDNWTDTAGYAHIGYEAAIAFDQ